MLAGLEASIDVVKTEKLSVFGKAFNNPDCKYFKVILLFPKELLFHVHICVSSFCPDVFVCFLPSRLTRALSGSAFHFKSSGSHFRKRAAL